MSTRPVRGSRPPVRLISYSRTAPGAADGGRAAAAKGPGPFRHPPSVAALAPPGPPPSRPPLRVVPAGERSQEDDLAIAAMATARVCAEVIAGVRPLHHLAGRATPEVYDRLGTTLPAARPATVRHSNRRLRVTVPQVQVSLPNVAEVSAVVFTGGNAHALALRLERMRGRWRCAAVETTLSPRQPRDQRVHRPGTAA